MAGLLVFAAAQLGVMSGFGSLVVYTFGIFLKPLSAEFGWSREAVSRAFSLAAMSIGVASPLLGHALDRYGPRAALVPCFAVFGTSLWQFYALFVSIGLSGNGTAQMGYSGAVASWFDRRRGFALACVLAGTGIGSIFHPVVAQRLIDAGGWRQAYLIFGILSLLIGIVPTSAWVQMNPGTDPAVHPAAGVSSKVTLRSREFWILDAVQFLISISVNGALRHLPILLTDRGISAIEAARATGILGVANLARRLHTGWLLDRMTGARLLFVLTLVMAVGLMLLSQARSLPAAAVEVVLIGFSLGGEADITPYLLTRYFGLDSFSTLYGLIWTFYAMAGGIGQVLFARFFEVTSSYVAVLTAWSALTALAGLMMLAMRAVPRN